MFEERKRFQQTFEDYRAKVLQPTRIEIQRALAEWRDRQYWAKYVGPEDPVVPAPLARLAVRVKKIESSEDKILRKRAEFPEGLARSSLERMHDAVAGRAVVYFISQLPMLDAELRSHPGFEHHPEIRAVAYLPAELHERLGIPVERREKLSGYASLHYCLRLKRSDVPLSERPWFEFQVRTLAEDVWGEIEHILGYKPDKETTFSVREQFRLLSKHLQAIDEHFDLLSEELRRQQRELKEIENSDLLNAETLPLALKELRIPCSQRDIDGLLKILASRDVKTVGDLRGLVEVNALHTIRTTWRTETREDATNFDIIGTLVSAPEAKDTAGWAKATKVQIAIKSYSHGARKPPRSNDDG